MSSTAAWVARILFFIIFCITAYIFQLNVDFKKKSTDATNKRIALKIWSRFGLISCTISSLFFISMFIPYICAYTAVFGYAYLFVTKLTLTFYQITRLRYCFLDKEYGYIGYHPYIFILLYIIGSVFCIWIFIAAYIILNVTYDNNNYKCSITREQDAKYFIILLFLAILFFIWDITVLVLYIIKMCQITKMRKVDDTILKIQQLLSKIITLTVVYEISVIYALTLNVLPPDISRIVFDLEIPATIDILTICFVMHLMIEKNNDHYLKLKSLIYVCCCCSIEKEIDDIETDKNKKDHELTTTSDLGIVDKKEMTQTESFVDTGTK